MEEGMTKEMAEGMAVVAKTMLADAEPVEKIIRYTGLTQAEIEGLRTSKLTF